MTTTAPRSAPSHADGHDHRTGSSVPSTHPAATTDPDLPDDRRGHEDRSGYWYADQPDGQVLGVDVLNALRRYRASELEMRRRTRDSMGMGDTDLLALRLLLRAQRQGRNLSPRDLARALAISSASTTVLIDRLVASGHVERQAHPTDRRSIIVVATAESDSEVRATLGDMHRRMIDAADALDPQSARAVFDFLEAMRAAVDANGRAPRA